MHYRAVRKPPVAIVFECPEVRVLRILRGVKNYRPQLRGCFDTAITLPLRTPPCWSLYYYGDLKNIHYVSKNTKKLHV